MAVALNSLMNYLEEESFPESKDLFSMVAFSIFFPIFRFILDRYLFERQGRKYILKDHDDLSEEQKEAKVKTHSKFKESCWKSTYYTVAEILAITVTLGEPWLFDSKMLWMGPGEAKWPNQMMKRKLKILYAFVGGFYIYSIFALVFWETRRKDFGVSLSHHVVTALLIVVSYLVRFGRITSIVLAIHDVSDVFLELAKTNRYVGNEFNATILFALFAISWLICRMLYFPFHIIRSTSIEVLSVLDRKDYDKEGPPLYYGFNTLLIMLLVMHVYWFILILRVIARQITSNSAAPDDGRSDDEDDD